jgi:hypothetical protein
MAAEPAYVPAQYVGLLRPDHSKARADEGASLGLSDELRQNSSLDYGRAAGVRRTQGRIHDSGRSVLSSLSSAASAAAAAGE